MAAPWKWLKIISLCSIALFLTVCILFGLVLGWAEVGGISMNPTLQSGDIIIFQRLGYEPKYGDIVIADVPRYRLLLGEDSVKERLVKRIIGLPGDTLEFDKEHQIIYRNGEPLDEPYLAPNELVDGKDRGTEPFVVPEGHIFVMGDNRQNSADSRSYSVWNISKSDIVGGALFSFRWPH